MHIEHTKPTSDHNDLKHSGRTLPNRSISFLSIRSTNDEFAVEGVVEDCLGGIRGRKVFSASRGGSMVCE